MNTCFIQQRKIFLHAIVVVLFVARLSWAQPSLEVSQVTFEDRFVAVVDGEKVKEGDIIKGFTVIEIGKDYVIFTSESGDYFLREIPRQSNINKIPAGKKDKSDPVDAQTAALQGFPEIKKNISQADVYVAEAQRVLTSHRVISKATYQQVLGLYEKAERELQFALEKTMVPYYQEKIRAAIDSVWADKDRIYKEKAGLQDAVNKAVANHQVVIGMTKGEVLKSWGKAAQINRANYAGNREEQWVYGTSLEDARYLYFDGDVLTSMQY